MMKRSCSQSLEETSATHASGKDYESEEQLSVVAKRAKISNDDVDKSGADPENWNSMWERLASFKREQGHMPQIEEDAELTAWVNRQRELYKAAEGGAKLTVEQVELLNKIGFEWQPRNPRHLQWETRFSQLQRFKAKHGHAQVPIGWPENVQLANWVSKQRQEYKNLLRGRTTRLDENRIRLLNSVGFAWQLQRGGRRRQLKARNKNKQAQNEKPSDGESTASEGNGPKSKAGDKEAEEEPSILPGEVLIGQGAPVPMSPGRRSSEDLHHHMKMGPKKSQGSSVECAQSLGPGPTPSPPALRQSLQQTLHQPPSFLAPSTMGMHLLNRARASGGSTQAGLTVPNNGLLDFVLARNALIQNLHRPQATNQPSLQMLSGHGAYPHLGSQGPAHSRLFGSATTQRNSFLPVLSQQPASLFSLGGTNASLTTANTVSTATNTASTAASGTTNTWRAASATGATPSPGSWSNPITSSLLDAGQFCGARTGNSDGIREEESKLSDGSGGRSPENRLH